MTDAQFKTYLTNLEKGVTGLASKPAYISDPEVQNILKFLVYEINSTITAMGVVNSTSTTATSSSSSSSSSSSESQYNFTI